MACVTAGTTNHTGYWSTPPLSPLPWIPLICKHGWTYLCPDNELLALKLRLLSMLACLPPLVIDADILFFHDVLVLLSISTKKK